MRCLSRRSRANDTNADVNTALICMPQHRCAPGFQTPSDVPPLKSFILETVVCPSNSRVKSDPCCRLDAGRPLEVSDSPISGYWICCLPSQYRRILSTENFILSTE